MCVCKEGDEGGAGQEGEEVSGMKAAPTIKVYDSVSQRCKIFAVSAVVHLHRKRISPTNSFMYMRGPWALVGPSPGRGELLAGTYIDTCS